MVVPQSSPPFRRLPAFLCVGAALVGNLVAQAPVRLAQETALLRDPGGLRLISLVPGLRLQPKRVSGNFLEVSVSGWIFTASTKPDRRDGFALSVSVTGGENLRAEPDGALLGRAVEGALFSRVGARGGWTQVRRTGWIARNAVEQRSRQAGRIPSEPAVPRNDPVPTPAPESTTAPPAAAPPAAPVQETASGPAVARNDSLRRGALKPGAVIQQAPDGAALATVTSPAVVVLGERDREWVKVLLEGWVRARDVQGNVAPLPAVTAAMLRANPDRYIGQTVEWRLQFLAHQQADELRPEMPLGRAYLLARGPLPETGFVYVMVSKQQADQLQGLKPLDEVTATVTVRSARTRYLATPVVELIRVGGGK
jgi:hypothetical protein